MQIIPLYHETASTDPYANLACERVLLENIGPGQVIFYLWQNMHTVVIGKNQNAWRECKVDLLRRERGKLARRTSGGGAVYHDTGNLNFSFIMDRELYDVEKQMSVVLKALQSLNIFAETQGRNDLVVGGRKFSGNAFRFTRQGALHHGTLLVNTDLGMLARYLQVSEAKMNSKGIESVPARVCNLTEFARIRIPELKTALRAAFDDTYGASTPLEIDEQQNQCIEEMTRWHASWDWNFGETPSFDIQFETRFDWGEVIIQLSLTQGHIDHATVYSDAMDEAFIGAIAPRLTGCPFIPGDMANAIQAVPVHKSAKAYADELAAWMAELEI